MQIYSLVKIPEKATEQSASLGIDKRYSAYALELEKLPKKVYGYGEAKGSNAFDIQTGTLVIPEGYTDMTENCLWALHPESIRHLVIPASMRNIHERTLAECNNLREITVAEENNHYQALFGTICSLDEEILLWPVQRALTELERKCLQIIGRNRLIIEEDAEIIKQDSHSTSYVDIDLFEIEDGVLKKCKNIGDGNVIISSCVSQIGDCAFYDCSYLVSLEIPSSVTQIGNGAFAGCSSLNSINIPSKVTQIGDGVFARCSGLTSIEIPPSVTRMGDSAFLGCSSLVSIEIPPNVSLIGNHAFYECVSLVSIEIPPSITQIGDCAFWGCINLESIEIPSSVGQVGRHAFAKCNNLTDIFYEGSKSEWKKLGANIPKKINVHYDYRK